jgi:hypothetical protein
MQNPYETTIERSPGTMPSSSFPYLMGCAIFVLAPIALVTACTLNRGPIPWWVHPQVEGVVVDARTGQPIENATVRFERSEFGGGTTATDAEGKFVLSPVVEMRWFALPGDPGFKSAVVASANGYHPVEHETWHGDREVWGGRPAPKRLIDFWLDQGEDGRAVETMAWPTPSNLSDAPSTPTETSTTESPANQSPATE